MDSYIPSVAQEVPTMPGLVEAFYKAANPLLIPAAANAKNLKADSTLKFSFTLEGVSITCQLSINPEKVVREVRKPILQVSKRTLPSKTFAPSPLLLESSAPAPALPSGFRVNKVRAAAAAVVPSLPAALKPARRMPPQMQTVPCAVEGCLVASSTLGMCLRHFEAFPKSPLKVVQALAFCLAWLVDTFNQASVPWCPEDSTASQFVVFGGLAPYASCLKLGIFKPMLGLAYTAQSFVAQFAATAALQHFQLEWNSDDDTATMRPSAASAPADGWGVGMGQEPSCVLKFYDFSRDEADVVTVQVALRAGVLDSVCVPSSFVLSSKRSWKLDAYEASQFLTSMVQGTFALEAAQRPLSVHMPLMSTPTLTALLAPTVPASVVEVKPTHATVLSQFETVMLSDEDCLNVLPLFKEDGTPEPFARTLLPGLLSLCFDTVNPSWIYGTTPGNKLGRFIVVYVHKDIPSAWVLASWFTAEAPPAKSGPEIYEYQNAKACSAMAFSQLQKYGDTAANVLSIDAIISRPGTVHAAAALLRGLVHSFIPRFAQHAPVWLMLEPLHAKLMTLYENMDLGYSVSGERIRLSRFSHSSAVRFVGTRILGSTAAGPFVAVKFPSPPACKPSGNTVLNAFLKPFLEADEDVRRKRKDICQRLVDADEAEYPTLREELAQVIGKALAAAAGLADVAKETWHMDELQFLSAEETVVQCLRQLKVLKHAMAVDMTCSPDILERLLPDQLLTLSSAFVQATYYALLTALPEAVKRARVCAGYAKRPRTSTLF